MRLRGFQAIITHLEKPRDRCYKESGGCHLFDVPMPQVNRLSLGIRLPILWPAPLFLLPHHHPPRMIRNLKQGKLLLGAAFPDCELKTVAECHNISHQMINGVSSVLRCCFLTNFTMCLALLSGLLMPYYVV